MLKGFWIETVHHADKIRILTQSDSFLMKGPFLLAQKILDEIKASEKKRLQEFLVAMQSRRSRRIGQTQAFQY